MPRLTNYIKQLCIKPFLNNKGGNTNVTFWLRIRRCYYCFVLLICVINEQSCFIKFIFYDFIVPLRILQYRTPNYHSLFTDSSHLPGLFLSLLLNYEFCFQRVYESTSSLHYPLYPHCPDVWCNRSKEHVRTPTAVTSVPVFRDLIRAQKCLVKNARLASVRKLGSQFRYHNAV